MSTNDEAKASEFVARFLDEGIISSREVDAVKATYLHALKRGRAMGTANAVRTFSETLPGAMREQCAKAWDEGFTRGFYDPKAGGDRDASESGAPNPYEETSHGD